MGLDLNRIEAWTREMLEAEARRRRIRSPEFRTRGELVRLILKHQYGARFNAGRERVAKGLKTIEETRDLMAQVVSSTLAAIPDPLHALRRLRGQLPGRAASMPPMPSAPEPEPAPEPAPATEAPRAQPAPAASTATTGASDAAPAAELPPRANGEAQSRAGASGPSTRTFIEEPIRTHSMARLLAWQGHRERALAIYEELLAQNSADRVLRAEAEAVREGRPIDPPVLPDPHPAAERALPDAGDRLQCKGRLGDGLRLRWQISEDGQQRARAVLGDEGELAVRLVAIRPDPARVVRSEITEYGPVAADDAWHSPPLPADVRCFAAVGLRSGERFVAIVHAHPEVEREADAQRQLTAL